MISNLKITGIDRQILSLFPQILSLTFCPLYCILLSLCVFCLFVYVLLVGYACGGERQGLTMVLADLELILMHG